MEVFISIQWETPSFTSAESISTNYVSFDIFIQIFSYSAINFYYLIAISFIRENGFPLKQRLKKT